MLPLPALEVSLFLGLNRHEWINWMHNSVFLMGGALQRTVLSTYYVFVFSIFGIGILCTEKCNHFVWYFETFFVGVGSVGSRFTWRKIFFFNYFIDPLSYHYTEKCGLYFISFKIQKFSKCPKAVFTMQRKKCCLFFINLKTQKSARVYQHYIPTQPIQYRTMTINIHIELKTKATTNWYWKLIWCLCKSSPLNFNQ